MAKRIREREIGYIAAQRIDTALMAIEEAIRDARAIASERVSADAKYLKLANLIDELHEARTELKLINRVKADTE